MVSDLNLKLHFHSRYKTIMKIKLFRIDETKCPVEPLHFNWDSSGLKPSLQKTQWVVTQTWSAGQSLPFSQRSPRPFRAIKVIFDGYWKKNTNKTYLWYTLTGTRQVLCHLHTKYTSLYRKSGLRGSPCLLHMFYLGHWELLMLSLVIVGKNDKTYL